MLSLPFVTNAIISIVLSSILGGIIGTYIVTRRMVFLSGGISHASFGGIGIAYFLGINPLIGAAVFSLLSAFGLHYSSSFLNLRNDSSIGILWALGMALGVFFIYLTPGYAPNLMSYLFGSILLVSKTDIILLAIITIITVFIFVRYFYQILFVSFDSEYAKTRGINVNRLNLILLCLITFVIVLNIKVAGIILVISLMTIPANIASIITKDYKKIMLLSVVFCLLGSLIGLALSLWLNLPSGASIVIVLTILLALTKVISYFFLKEKAKKY